MISAQLDGLGRYTRELVRAMLRRPAGIDLRVLVPAHLPADHPLRALLDELRPPVVISDAPLMSARSHVTAAAAVRRERPDLYHFPHFNLPLGTPGRVISTIHDLVPLTRSGYFTAGAAYKKILFRAATAWTIRRSVAVITPSDATGDDVRRLFRPRARVVTIAEGVDASFASRPAPQELDRFRAAAGLTGPYLLYVGVDRPHKNLRRVVTAYAQVARRVPHALVLAGQHGVDDEVATLVREHGLEARVRRTGYLGERDLRAAYAGADAFVYCSIGEGFGLPVLEAMRSGAPVVTSRLGATAEVAGDSALLVDPYSVDAIAAALERVCSREELRQELRAKGQRRAELYTWERAADRTLELYRSVLE